MNTKFTTLFGLFTAACILLVPLSRVDALDLGRPSVSIGSSFLWETGLDGSPGAKVAVNQFGADLALPLQLNHKADLGMHISANRYNFHWDNADQIAFSNGTRPWSRLQMGEADLHLNYRFNPRWFGFARVGLGIGWEDETSDAVSFIGALGGGYRFGSDWSLSLGLASGETPIGGYFGPFGTIGWHQERSENFVPGWFGKLSFPPYLEIGCGLSDRWRLRGFFGVFGGLFRLADENKASPAGYFAPTANMVGLYLDHRPIPALVLSLGAKYSGYTEWKILDDDGNTIRTLELHNSPSVELKISYNF